MLLLGLYNVDENLQVYTRGRKIAVNCQSLFKHLETYVNGDHGDNGQLKGDSAKFMAGVAATEDVSSNTHVRLEFLIVILKFSKIMAKMII